MSRERRFKTLFISNEDWFDASVALIKGYVVAPRWFAKNLDIPADVQICKRMDCIDRDGTLVLLSHCSFPELEKGEIIPEIKYEKLDHKVDYAKESPRTSQKFIFACQSVPPKELYPLIVGIDNDIPDWKYDPFIPNVEVTKSMLNGFYKFEILRREYSRMVAYGKYVILILYDNKVVAKLGEEDLLKKVTKLDTIDYVLDGVTISLEPQTKNLCLDGTLDEILDEHKEAWNSLSTPGEIPTEEEQELRDKEVHQVVTDRIEKTKAEATSDKALEYLNKSKYVNEDVGGNSLDKVQGCSLGFERDESITVKGVEEIHPETKDEEDKEDSKDWKELSEGLKEFLE